MAMVTSTRTVLIVLCCVCVHLGELEVVFASDDIFLEKFHLIYLPLLKPDPIEQNLSFRVENKSFEFKLIPRYALVTPSTNISAISVSYDDFGQANYRITDKINASQYSKWNFEGFMSGEPTVIIHGSVNKTGHFEGYFIRKGDVYIIEPSTKYDVKSKNNLSCTLEDEDANSIVFKVSDVCRKISKLKDEHKGDDITRCQKYGDIIKHCDESKPLSRRRNAALTQPEYQSVVGELAMLNQQTLLRRHTTPLGNTTYLCNLKIILDHRFYKYVAKNDRNISVSLVVSLMTKVDKIFRKVDFNEDGNADNIGFYIEELAIYKEPVRNVVRNQSSAWNPTKFFQEFRDYDFSGFCAGLLFTFREMQTAEEYGPSLIKTQLVNEDQGICSTLKVTIPKQSMSDYGEFIANALPVNFRVNGIPACESHMVVQVLHQLGHLFGAPNDDFYSPEDQCCKQMLGRTFIMAFPIPTGDQDDHLIFSSCSVMAMSNYLSKSSRPCLRACEGPQCDRPLLGARPIARFVQRNVTRTIFPPYTGQTASRDWTEYCFTVPRSRVAGSFKSSLSVSIFFLFLLLLVELNV